MKCVKCGVDETPKWYRRSKGTPTCCACYSKEYRKNHPEKVAENLRKYASSEKGRKREKRYAKSEKGHIASRRRNQRYKESNPEKILRYQSSEQRRKISRKQYKRKKLQDPEYFAFKAAKKRSIKHQAKPDWVNQDQILEVYQDCVDLQRLSEEPLEVDHIIPLVHDKVCGLHVPWNLQILTKSNNRSKSNKFDGTYENNSWRGINEYLLFN